MSSLRSQDNTPCKHDLLPSYTQEPILPTYEDEVLSFTTSSPSRPRNFRTLWTQQRHQERDLELGNVERTTSSAAPEGTYVPPEVPSELTPALPSSALLAPTPQNEPTRASWARLASATRSSSDETMPPLRYYCSHPQTPAAAATAAAEAAAPTPEDHPELTSASRARLESAASASRGEDNPPLRYYWSHPGPLNPAAAPAPEPAIIPWPQVQIIHRVQRSFRAMGACSLVITIVVMIALGVAFAVWEAMNSPTGTV